MNRTAKTRSFVARFVGIFAAAALAAPCLAQNVVPEGVVNSCNSPIIGTLDSSVGFDGSCSEILMPVTWDFYTFRGAAGQVVEFEVDRTSSNFDPELAVWQGDPTGVALSSFTNPSTCSDVSVTWLDTFRNEDPPAVPGPSGDPHGSVVLPADGQYFIIVASTCSAGAANYDYILRSTNVTCFASITNTDSGMTYGTLQDAISSAMAGDTIEIGSGVVYEHGIFMPANTNIRIVGAGADQTFIDAQRQDEIVLISSGTIAFEGLTFMNSLPTIGNRGAMNLLSNSATVTVTDCAFTGNEQMATGAASAANIRGGSNCRAVFNRCRFNDNVGNIGTVGVDLGSHADFINCLFAGNHNNRHMVRTGQNSTAQMINCTIADCPTPNGSMIQALVDSSLTTTSCVFDGSGGSDEFGGIGTHTISYNLYPGAAPVDGNTDGLPVFEDEANGDYRLAAGSPGIDAADADAYTASGVDTLDLNGDPRFHDDTGTDDTGSGVPSDLDMGAYEFQGTTPVPCLGDIDASNTVDVDDLNALLGAWNTSVTAGGPLDLANDDGFVDVDDLNVVLGNWGNNCE